MHVIKWYKLKEEKENILSYLPIDVNVISSLFYRWDNPYVLSYLGKMPHGRSMAQDTKILNPSINASVPFEKKVKFEAEHSSRNEVSKAYIWTL